MIDPARVFQELRLTMNPDGRMQADWSVPMDLPYFRGHFPGNPVFPAVGIVDATLETLRTQTQNPFLSLAGIKVAKFLQPITPGLKVRLELTSVTGDEWQAQWTDQASGQLLCSLHLRCV